MARIGFLLALTVAALAPRAAHADPSEGTRVWLRAVTIDGRSLDLERLRGQVVVLTAATRATAGEAEQIAKRLHRLAKSGEAVVVTVVNLDDVPFFARGYARRRVAEAAAGSPSMVITDDHGGLCRSLAMQGTDMMVVDQRGLLAGRFRGRRDLDRVEQTVEDLRRTYADGR